ncbi:GatB/YqeY domain-containing protein [Amycolatopsis sp. NPDC051903]|uniref:GatB/YqeY domain-containing protein n=1 Tax=Amycolatopsis sp. NPDC051903 TaxID=3363936 RepID=UPI003797557F
MRASLRAGLTTALKNRDRVATTALRSALAAIDNAEAVPVDQPLSTAAGDEHVVGAALGVGAAETARRELTDTDVRAIVAHEVRERTTAADKYERLGRTDAAERLRAEAVVLKQHLEPLS